MNKRPPGASRLLLAALAGVLASPAAARTQGQHNPGGMAQWGIPDRLDIKVDSNEKCMAFDVYFNGVKQTECSVADVTKGEITRFINEKRTATETLQGVVQIVRIGAKPS